MDFEEKGRTFNLNTPGSVSPSPGELPHAWGEEGEAVGGVELAVRCQNPGIQASKAFQREDHDNLQEKPSFTKRPSSANRGVIRDRTGENHTKTTLPWDPL